MSISNGDECQTPSKEASPVGKSKNHPEPYHESRFVANEGGKLDVEHEISASGQLVTVCIETTRYVGTIDPDNGFLLYAQKHIEQRTLAETLLLTVHARISAVGELGGTFGVDGLEVEVFLHKDVPGRERSLGKLEGDFGTGSTDWQEFELEVNVRDVKFPDDPCPDQSPGTSCGKEIKPASNEITFKFTGTRFPIKMEVDWLMLEPKDAPGLAWRPVLLVHGLGADAGAMQAGTAWADGLQARDVAYHAVDLTPTGSITSNGVEIAQAVDDLKRRFGVERVHVVGHSKGGLDARSHVKDNDDVETLIMLGAPNEGSFIADIGVASAGSSPIVVVPVLYSMGFLEMSTAAMLFRNQSLIRNRKTNYVTAAGDYDSKWATNFATVYGGNDEIVSIASVESLPYAAAWTYLTSENDVISQGICRTENLFNHSCLRHNTRIVDELFPPYVAELTPPSPSPPLPPRPAGAAALKTIPPPLVDTTNARSRRSRAPAMAPLGRVEGSAATGAQGVMSDGGIASDGITYSHPAIVDLVDAAIFLILGNQDELRLELVNPTGSRIDAQTPLVDPTITYASFRDAGSLSYAGYYVEGPEVGGWTLEVTGTSVSSPDASPYALAVLAPLTPGTGVVLTARVDQELYAVGGAATITATITENGLPVTDATVEAVVTHPDGTTTTQIVLYDDGTNGDPAPGDGEYTGLFTATTEAGLYAIVASAQRTIPAFTREQVLLVPVAQSNSAFSGTISDHGADTDGDGLYNQLVIDVEVDVDVAAAYRVFGTLTDGAGTTIEQVRAQQELQPGLQTVSLSFDGAPLFARGYDGPHVIEDVMLEEVTTAMVLDRAPSYTTAAYAHTQFQRPPCLLTGNTSDHGVHSFPDVGGQLPYESLIVEVEVDMLISASVKAQAKLYTDDGAFIKSSTTFVTLPPGRKMMQFRFNASDIRRSGKPGPYALRLLTMTGTTLPVSLRAPGVVAVTQPYTLEDFRENPLYTVGGTVTGLVGTGLVLRKSSSPDLRPGNGAFAFTIPGIGGSSYDVRITRHPVNPIQVCSIANATGTIGTANVTDIAVHCVTPPPQEALDPSFGDAGKQWADHGDATAIALQSDGKIVLCGSRTLSRYHSDGSADTTFGTSGEVTAVFAEDANGSVLGAAASVAIQPDGKIVVAGYTRGATRDDFALARYAIDGALDPSFGTGGTVTTAFAGEDQPFGSGAQACTVLIQPDGNIVVAGTAETFLSVEFALARYTGTGTLDTSFGTGGKVTTLIDIDYNLAAAALLQPDGKIVVAGRVGLSEVDFGVVRYTADGAPDPSFGSNGNGIVRTDFGLTVFAHDLALQSDGKLVVVGTGDAGLPLTFALARFEATGRLDSNFGSAGLVTTLLSTQGEGARAHAVTIQPDGKIVVVGYDDLGTQEDFIVARYTVDGTLDPSFGTDGKITVDFFGGNDRAECVATQADDKIVVGGTVVNGSTGGQGLVRILP